MDKQENKIIHNFSETSSNPVVTKGVMLVFLVCLFMGITTGFAVSKITKQEGKTENGSMVTKDDVKTGMIVGSDDSIYKDIAEGILKEGGIEGEGSYHLERPGGESQYVYLTSSVLDLSLYVGKKVKVWGETQKAQRAGWLMNVGKLQVL